MNRIFVSHSTKDGSAEAQQLVAALEAGGLPCWIAPRDVKVGPTYPGQIVDAISESRGLVLVLTAAANASLDVLQEVTLAHNERKLIAALIVRDTQPSRDLSYFLGPRQRTAWTDASTAARELGKVFTPAGAPEESDPSNWVPRATLGPNHTLKRAPATLTPRVRSAADIAGVDLLPKHLRVLLEHSDPEVRLSEMTELARLLGDRSPSISMAARRALEWLKDDADARVSQVAASALTGSECNPGDVFRDGPDCPEMVVVPRGRFLMGSPGGDPHRDNNEGPVHEVTIDYWLAVARCPITRGEWQRYLAETGVKESRGADGFNMETGMGERKEEYCWSNPGFQQEDSHPVVCVTWNEAMAYGDWLSVKTCHRYRLLSEAEYEYVNRAGTRSAYWWGDASEDQWRYANGADAVLKAKHGHSTSGSYASGHDGFAYTSPVGHFPANPFGLHDTTGNVWCWTHDRWHQNYDWAPTDGSAWESGSDAGRVVRGGSWSSFPRRLRSACRDKKFHGVFNLGFRLARTAS
jgi:formylglycine-generating enzyme required for sulfatase activity